MRVRLGVLEYVIVNMIVLWLKEVVVILESFGVNVYKDRLNEFDVICWVVKVLERCFCFVNGVVMILFNGFVIMNYFFCYIWGVDGIFFFLIFLRCYWVLLYLISIWKLF